MVRIRPGSGTLMVLGSAASFGTLPILVKLAYATGLTPFQTLAFRFLFAAAGLHFLAWLRGEHVFRAGARRLIQFLLLGVVGYAAQSAAFFGALCCLPGGSANVFGKMLGIPGDLVDATEHLLAMADDWSPRKVDLGVVNGRCFTFASGLGLDASVVERVDANPRLKARFGAYLLTWIAVSTDRQRPSSHRGRDHLRRPAAAAAGATSPSPEPCQLAGSGPGGGDPLHGCHLPLPRRPTSDRRAPGGAAQHVRAGGDCDAGRHPARRQAQSGTAPRGGGRCAGCGGIAARPRRPDGPALTAHRFPPPGSEFRVAG